MLRVYRGYEFDPTGMRAERLEAVVPLHAAGAGRPHTEHGLPDVDAGPGRRGRLLQHPGVSDSTIFVVILRHKW